MFEIRPKHQLKKHSEYLDPKNFQVFMAGTAITKGKISKRMFEDYLNQTMNRGLEKTSQASQSTEVKEAEVKELITQDSKIIEVLQIKNIDNKINLLGEQEGEKFTIRASYLPEDDEAPQRVFNKTKELLDIFNEYVSERNKSIESFENEKLPPNLYTVHQKTGALCLSTGEVIETDKVDTSIVLNTIHYLMYGVAKKGVEATLKEIKVSNHRFFNVQISDKEIVTKVELNNLDKESMSIAKEIFPHFNIQVA